MFSDFVQALKDLAAWLGPWGVVGVAVAGGLFALALARARNPRPR